jgi:hypothetical protein
VVSLTPLPHYPQGKSPWYPLDGSLSEKESVALVRQPNAHDLNVVAGPDVTRLVPLSYVYFIQHYIIRRFPGMARDSLLFCRHVQTCFGAHPASCPIGAGSYSPGLQRPDRETDCSSPSAVEVKHSYSYSSTHPYVFKAWFLIK